MSIEPPPPDRPPPPLGSTPVTPTTDTRRVIAGTAVPVAAVLSWLFATLSDNFLWYALVVVVAIVAGAVYVRSGRSTGRDRKRDRTAD